MMADCKCSFDESGQRLAILSSDGRLRVWDCSSGKLRQEFVTTTSLDATCTCLCWSKSRSKKEYSSKKKAKRKKVDTAVDVALGTSDGSVVILDTNAGEIRDRLTGGHTSKVNGISYCTERDTIYTCSDDKYITEWSSSLLQVNTKWIGNKQAVKAVAVGPSGRTLLSAGRLIKLWDLDTKQMLQRFHGHLNVVKSLSWTSVRSESHDPDCHTSGYYFLSSAENEELVNAWQVNLTKPEKNAVASFILPSPAICMDFCVSNTDQQPLKLTVACQNGEICSMSHALNGRCVKPIATQHCTKIMRSIKKDKGNRVIDVLGLKFADSQQPSLVLVYGSYLKPVFEKVALSELQREPVLERDISTNLLQSNESGNEDKVTTVGVSSSMGYTVHGDLSSVRPVAPLVGQKDKQEGDAQVITDGGVPFSQRVQEFLPPRQVAERVVKPTAASTSNLIVQSLQSDDTKMLFNLLRRTQTQTAIRATIERLPIKLIIPFLKKLSEKIETDPIWVLYSTNWLRVVIEIHMSYLLSVPNLRHSLAGLFQILNDRTTSFDKLSRLHGRLDLILSYAASQPSDESALKLQTPALSFNDDDSDVEGHFEDSMMFRHRDLAFDSEDEWNPSAEDNVLDDGGKHTNGLGLNREEQDNNEDDLDDVIPETDEDEDDAHDILV